MFFVRISLFFQNPVCLEDFPGGFSKRLCGSERTASLWCYAHLSNKELTEEEEKIILEHAKKTFPNNDIEYGTLQMLRVQRFAPSIPEKSILNLTNMDGEMF